MACDKMLELLPHRGDQRRVRAKMLLRSQTFLAADLHNRAAERVLHILEAQRERTVERPHQRRFDAVIARCHPPHTVTPPFHLPPSARKPACRATICSAISAAGLGPKSPAP